jgi:hypothetical protein
MTDRWENARIEVTIPLHLGAGEDAQDHVANLTERIESALHDEFPTYDGETPQLSPYEARNFTVSSGLQEVVSTGAGAVPADPHAAALAELQAIRRVCGKKRLLALDEAIGILSEASRTPVAA